MTQSSPARVEQSYRHEAFLWHDRADFTDSLVPFVTDGLDAGEPVMVAVVDEHVEWLREALGPQGDQVKFFDMASSASNPAKIIPAWQKFLDTDAADSRPARGVGEPIWAGRRRRRADRVPDARGPAQRGRRPDDPVLAGLPVRRGRAGAVGDRRGLPQSSGGHRGRRVPGQHLLRRPRPPGDDAGPGAAHAGRRADHHPVLQPNLGRLRAFLKLEGHVAGLGLQQAADLATVTSGLAADSLERGATGGTIRVWRQPRSVVCEVIDDTHLDDPLAGRRAPLVDGADALWAANQLCDLVQLRTTPTGTTVRVHAYR